MEDLRWDWRVIGGPYYYLSLCFKQSQSEIEAIIRPLLAEEWEFEPQSWAPLNWYHKDSREFRYTTIRIVNDELTIERAWAELDKKFTRALLFESPLSVRFWRVFTGGDGYATTYLRSGSQFESLIRYCKEPPAEPDFSNALRQLKESLAEHGLEEKYRICKPTFEHNRMKVEVLYEVPFIDGAWQSEPASTELNSIAREVSDKCQISVLCSATSTHAPDNWHQLIGGGFTFN